MNIKQLVTIFTLSMALTMTSCSNDVKNEKSPGQLNTEDVDKARDTFEQFENNVASQSEEEKLRDREKKNKEQGIDEEVRRSDAITENSSLKEPQLSAKDKEKSEERNLPKDVKNFKEDNNATILENMGYHGYDENKYISVKDKLYHRYISGKKKEDKATGKDYDNAVEFFMNGAEKASNAPEIDSYNKPSPEQIEYFDKLSNSTFNQEDSYLEKLGLLQKIHGNPKIIGVTRDYDDKGLYQVQFEYQDKDGKALADGISYYFVDTTGAEQLQIQRLEYTIFGAYETSQNIDNALKGN